MLDSNRQIPYNYTSADDRQIITFLFEESFLQTLDALKNFIRTGRSARLLYRIIGDLFILKRNSFLFQEVTGHPKLKAYLYTQFKNDLAMIRNKAEHPKVVDLVEACAEKVNELFSKINTFHELKSRLKKHFTPAIGKNNIYFDAFTLCAHSTDATDWRLHVPLAVLRPDQESQVPTIVKIIKNLGLYMIPRGAGTGLTGGATPLSDYCVMINTEKLNSISRIRVEPGKDGKDLASIRLGAGVITQEAIDYADRNGYIFATDPTSAWACTIGGNIAENAGGKKAVLFGTAIDNLLSWSMTLPDGKAIEVKRIGHPQRKIDSDDLLFFDVFDDQGGKIDSIRIEAGQIRKKGLGKDVTNKTLNGLSGVQKEGCDGIITSATFILYPKFKFKATVCIEFFGNDMSQAGRVISLLTNAFSDRKPALMALEHFDEAYIKAIQYKTKTAIGNRIIAVLLLDLVSNDKTELQNGLEQITSLLDPYDKTGFKIAADEKASERFWKDRKKLGAIAAHTNAFKLNEDIVIPIEALAGFAGWVDNTNIEEKLLNQKQIIDNIISYLDTAKPLSDSDWFTKRVGQSKDLAFAIKKKLEIASRDAIEAYIHAKNFYDGVEKKIHGYTHIIENIYRIYHDTKSRMIVIATHMHAGDGNVHVNIPVLSNDRQMMKRANYIADRVMEKAVALGGVVSGEHGIGITKFKHLDQNKVDELTAYRNKIDPDGLMNPKKLSDLQVLDTVFTPSFNLLDIEAKILKHTSLSELAMKVANCVRCGKCKISCPVFYPDENLFYHPRNKNLGIGSLIEALLYITQRTQSTAFKILRNIEQIADHCTLCRKCFIKCPVNIDTSQISIDQRNLLRNNGFKHTGIPTRMSLNFLRSKNRTSNALYRNFLLKPAARTQRIISKAIPPKAKNAKANQGSYFDLVRTPLTRPHARPLSAYVPRTEKNQSILLQPESDPLKTVFYFPGCGSERLFSKISMAAIYLLLSQGTRVVLPPANFCCGYPFKVNAQFKNLEKIQLENIIVFSQIRSMFQDLVFDACIVSCGTCMAALTEIGLDQFFNSEIVDISQYILQEEKDLVLPHDYLYHAPCHDSLKDTGLDLLQGHLDTSQIRKTDHCCSEAGTMALSRPHISYAMFKRKQNEVQKRGGSFFSNVLTNCPACIQGLGRLNNGELNILHIAEELACVKGGEDWIDEFKRLVQRSEVVTF